MRPIADSNPMRTKSHSAPTERVGWLWGRIEQPSILIVMKRSVAAGRTGSQVMNRLTSSQTRKSMTVPQLPAAIDPIEVLRGGWRWQS